MSGVVGSSMTTITTSLLSLDGERIFENWWACGKVTGMSKYGGSFF